MLCRTFVRCGLLQSGTLNVRAYDLLQVVVDGIIAGKLWRAKPSSLWFPHNVCKDAEANVTVSLLVSTYGRDNFYVSGTAEEVLKGIVGAVRLKPADGTSVQLTGWYARYVCRSHAQWFRQGAQCVYFL